MFDWSGDEVLRDGVRCRTFRPIFARGLDSAAIFDRVGTPSDSLLPIILFQHGGSSSKTGLDVWDVATELVGQRNFRLIALDGPVHGARALPNDPADGVAVRARFFELWGGEPAHVMQHVQRWQSLTDELYAAMPGVDCRWLGLSMGAAYGLPLLSIEKRITRAVLGMWGTSFVNSGRLVADAAAVSCPVLFQQKWDDELFTREGQLALFDALGTDNKRLHIYPGGHVRLGPEQMHDLSSFLCGD